MAKLVSSAPMIRILKQALHTNIEVYALFVYIKIELCGSHRIAVFVVNLINFTKQFRQIDEILLEFD